MTKTLTSVGVSTGLDDVIIGLNSSSANWVAGDTVSVNGTIIYTLTNSDISEGFVGNVPVSQSASIAFTPPSAGTYSVQINSADGTQHSQAFSFSVTSEAAPTFTELDPSSTLVSGTPASLYAGQITNLGVVGTNFLPSNGTALTSVTISGPGLSSPDVIAVNTYAGGNTYSTTNGNIYVGTLGLKAGTYTVQVNSPEGTQHSSTLSFTLLADLQPQISSITTGIVAGAYQNAIRIIGSNFQEGDSVYVTAPAGSSSGTSFRLSFGYTGTNVPLPGLYSNSNEIDFALNAPDAGTYQVEIDSPDGTLKATMSFTATQQTTPLTATLSSINAAYFSSDNINQAMVLHGANFQQGAYLEFHAQTNANDTTYRVIPTIVSSTEADYTFNAATMIPAYQQGTVPASDTWTVDVVNPSGGFSNTANSLTFHTNPGTDPNPYQRVTIASGGVTFNLDFVKAFHPSAQLEQAVETAASIL
jgi:hypothetical protein